MPRFNVANPRIVCDGCGAVFARGWGYNQHLQLCEGPPGSPPERVYDDGFDEDASGNEEEANDDADDGLRIEGEEGGGREGDPTVTKPTMEEHFEYLDERGVYDLQHMLQYQTWGKTPMEDAEVEVCRFLRSNEVGGGSSDGKSTAALRYAKTLGGRGDLLPKTMKTCWATVDRVRKTV